MTTRTTHSFWGLPFVLSGALAAFGCQVEDSEQEADDDDVEVAEQAMTSSEGAGDITAMSSYFAEAGGVDEAAEEIESDVESAGCLTVSHEEDATIFEFDECVGRLGFLSMTGTLEVAESTEGEVVTYDLSTDELYLNHWEIEGDWQVTANRSAEEYTWQGSVSVTGPHGWEVQKQASADWSWDGTCKTFSAASEVEGRRGQTRTVEVDEVTRCQGECPSAGSVEVTFPGGATLSWTYNGDDTATVTGPRGGVFDVTLPCAY